MSKEKKKNLLPYIGVPILAVALLLVCWQRLEPFSLLQKELLLIIGYIVAVKDAKDRRIPNKIVLALLVCWVLTMIPQLVIDIESTLGMLKNSALGFVIGGGLFLLVYLISRGGLGGGDVKFMAVAGLYLGLNGILPPMLYGSILAALFGLVMILLKKIGRKDAIPLAPFLYAGILITIFL